MMPVGFRKTMCGESKGGKSRDRREAAREMARAAAEVPDGLDLTEYEEGIEFWPTDYDCDYDLMPPGYMDELTHRMRALPVATETPGPDLPDVLDW